MRAISNAILVGGVTLFAVAAAIVAAFHITGAVLNQSLSLPRGIYVPTEGPIVRGTIVFFRLPAVMGDYEESVGGAEFYAGKWNGILKPVVGIDGDAICRNATTDVFSVNGTDLGTALRSGPDGIPLPVWSGCRKLEAGELSVGSQRIESSLDSRYFREIDATRATPYRPWITLPQE